MVHAKQLHGHARHFRDFHRILLEGAQFKRMRQEGVNSMTSLMNHGSEIAHLSGRIHKDERCAGLG
jgi:hypothetical protein